MSQNADQVFDAALRLTEGERLELVTRLIETLPGEIADEEFGDDLMAELNQRAADSAGAAAWEDLRKRL